MQSLLALNGFAYRFGVKPGFLAALIIGCFLPVSAQPVCEGSKLLFVYYPSPKASPQVISNTLSPQFPGIEIIVFSRFVDFQAEIEANPPLAIIAKPSTINNINPSLLHTKEGGEYSMKLFGTKDRRKDEPFVLISPLYDKSGSDTQERGIPRITPLIRSNDDDQDPLNLTDKVLGIVDFLDRGAMEQIVGALFSNPPLQIRHVTKIEELLNILILNLAEAVLIPERQVPYFIDKSRLNFYLTEVPHARIDIISLAVRAECKDQSIIRLVQTLPQNCNELFGVDQWIEP
jgi:hypothetical protein